MLPPGMRAAVDSWRLLNPEYTYCYYNDDAMRAYVAAYGGLVPGFQAGFGEAPSGAMRCDMWRALSTWLEGGVYADADSVLHRPLREVLRPDDDAVSGVGHAHHGLEQHLLVYSACHPVMHRLLTSIVAEIRQRGGASHVKGWNVMNVTGPGVLKRVTAELLLNGSTRTPQFTNRGGVYPVEVRGVRGEEADQDWQWSHNRSVRVLAARYDCPGGQTYCADIGRFGGNVRFKYAGYERELPLFGATSYHELRPAPAAAPVRVGREVEEEVSQRV